jgi:hypothetical protein
VSSDEERWCQERWEWSMKPKVEVCAKKGFRIKNVLLMKADFL